LIEAGTREADQADPGASGPELVVDFLHDVRTDVEAGTDPLLAIQRAVATLPIRVRDAVEAVLRQLRGHGQLDEHGFDEQLAEALFGLVELGYDVWWRGGIGGIGNVPAHGGALLVANRAPLPAPIVAALIATAIMKRHPLPRWPRFMTGETALALPVAATLLRRCGAVPADPIAAVGLLERGELVCCFGERGFARIARRAAAPIVPVAILDSPARRIEFRAPIGPDPRYDRDDGRGDGNAG
jgi:hypothetical protein